MMDNLESVLQSLNEFDKSTAEKELTPELEQLLEHIAKTGKPVFPWPLLKPLICFKLEKVLNEFFESATSSNDLTSEPVTKSRKFIPEVEKLLTNLECFSGPPFTIQRICELITQPRKHYKTTDKFLRGVEKNILVVSTVQPDGSLLTRSPLDPPLANGSLSPTETTVPMVPSPTKISHNSPLNTNFHENGFVTSVEPTAESTEEKQAVVSESVDCRVDVQQEATQNGDEARVGDENVREEVKNDPEQKEDKEQSSSDSNVKQKQREANAIETVGDSQNEVTKAEGQVENEEKPAVEPTEKKEEEKMDES